MIDDEFGDDFDEDSLDAMGDEWLAANDPDADDDDEDAMPSASESADNPLAGFDFGDASDEPGEMSGDLAGDDAQLAWRETYYVLFGKAERPTLTQVEAAVTESGRSLQVENLQANDDGLFQSLLIQSPEDNSALEISFEAGDAVIEQSAELAKLLQNSIDGDQLAQLMRADARLDVMHFERIEPVGDFVDEDPDAMAMSAFDPATLITVVEALAHLTGGLPVDPAAGELLI